MLPWCAACQKPVDRAEVLPENEEVRFEDPSVRVRHVRRSTKLRVHCHGKEETLVGSAREAFVNERGG